jgi:cellulose synthase/poly-beta-1,6-N-acetylglucosamine synthase-like glycosyltransferase
MHPHKNQRAMTIFHLLFATLAIVMIAYQLRHYSFVSTALLHERKTKNNHKNTIRQQPTVSIIIPAHNEERVIEKLLQRTTELNYPKEKLQVIVVDDASTDNTQSIIKKYTKQHPHIKLIHRHKATTKAAALNEATKHAKGEIIYFFDADYLPDHDFIQKANTPFQNPKTGCVQTNIKVSNETTTVSKTVSLERIGSYRIDQLARHILGLIPQFGGTAGGIRRSLLESIGGFNTQALTEDTDLTIQIYLKGYKISYLHDTGSYEEAVENWRSYWKQRKRWATGHMQCACKHLWPLIKSPKLSLKEKIDGILLLNIYTVPILVGLGWLLAAVCLLLNTQLWTGQTALIITLIYLAAGNIAPLSGILVGAALEKRIKLCKYTPALLIAFTLNVFICTKAAIDIATSKILRKPLTTWNKTTHNGTQKP